MGIVCRCGSFLEDGICRYLRTAVCTCEPTQKLRVFARRLRRQNQLFVIDLLRRFALAVAHVPCNVIGVGGVLRVKRCAGRNRDGAVKTAAALGCEPPLERITGLDGDIARRGRLAVRLDGFTVRRFSVNRAAVAACVPCDGQGNSRTAVVAFAVAVRVHMIGVFIRSCLADRAGLRALVLRVAYACPLAIGVSMVGILIIAGGAGRAGFCAAMLGITVVRPRTVLETVVGIGIARIPAKAARRASAMLRIRVVFPAAVLQRVVLLCSGTHVGITDAAILFNGVFRVVV